MTFARYYRVIQVTVTADAKYRFKKVGSMVTSKRDSSFLPWQKQLAQSRMSRSFRRVFDRATVRLLRVLGRQLASLEKQPGWLRPLKLRRARVRLADRSVPYRSIFSGSIGDGGEWPGKEAWGNGTRQLLAPVFRYADLRGISFLKDDIIDLKGKRTYRKRVRRIGAKDPGLGKYPADFFNPGTPDVSGFSLASNVKLRRTPKKVATLFFVAATWHPGSHVYWMERNRYLLVYDTSQRLALAYVTTDSSHDQKRSSAALVRFLYDTRGNLDAFDLRHATYFDGMGLDDQVTANYYRLIRYRRRAVRRRPRRRAK